MQIGKGMPKESFKKSLINEAKKKFFVKVVTKQLVAFLITKAAFIAWGPVGWFVSLVVSKILSLAINKTILGINLVFIDLSIGSDVKKLDKVRKKVNLITDKTTEKELDAIDKEIEDAFVDLIKFNRRKL